MSCLVFLFSGLFFLTFFFLSLFFYRSIWQIGFEIIVFFLLLLVLLLFFFFFFCVRYLLAIGNWDRDGKRAKKRGVEIRKEEKKERKIRKVALNIHFF